MRLPLASLLWPTGRNSKGPRSWPQNSIQLRGCSACRTDRTRCRGYPCPVLMCPEPRHLESPFRLREGKRYYSTIKGGGCGRGSNTLVSPVSEPGRSTDRPKQQLLQGLRACACIVIRRCHVRAPGVCGEWPGRVAIKAPHCSGKKLRPAAKQPVSAVQN